MPLETKYSSRFDSAGNPLNGRVARPLGGTASDIGFITNPAIDDIGDLNAFLAVPVGAELQKVEWDTPDLDTNGSPTIDMDVVLRTWDSAGAVVDTVLLDAGTIWNAASKTHVFLDKVKVPESQKGYGIVGLKVVAVTATAGTGVAKLRAEWT